MPPVRAVSFVDDVLTIDDLRGQKVLLKSQAPANVNSIAKWETFANDWAATNIPDYQVRVHITSLTPLRGTIGTWNLGDTIPVNWWLDA